MAIRAAEAPGLRVRSTRAPRAHDTRPPVRRTHVLLVDYDILANQLVTATLLRREGHMVDVVANGQAAADALRRSPYDLIFMDIFMRGTPGQETARIIRSLPAPAVLTPIIALTANLMPEHEAAYKASGIDRILAKPVSVAELLDVLHSHVWSRQDVKPAEPAEAPVMAPLNDPWAVLSHARIRELRTTLAPETFVNLVEECIADLDHRLPALLRAVTSANSGAVTAHAHAMVGMAAGYGMAALETRLRTILAAAREGNTQTLSGPFVAKIEADLAEAARMLRNLSHSGIV